MKCHREFVKAHVADLLEKGILRDPNSPFNSPIWIVPKKGNKLRVTVDYRKMNKDTDKDAYTLPVIDDILDHLGKVKFFSAFDLSSDFHEIPMNST